MVGSLYNRAHCPRTIQTVGGWGSGGRGGGYDRQKILIGSLLQLTIVLTVQSWTEYLVTVCVGWTAGISIFKFAVICAYYTNWEQNISMNTPLLNLDGKCLKTGTRTRILWQEIIYVTAYRSRHLRCTQGRFWLYPELKYQLNMVQFIFTRLDTLNFNMFVIISYCSFKYVNSESFKLIQ